MGWALAAALFALGAVNGAYELGEVEDLTDIGQVIAWPFIAIYRGLFFLWSLL